MNRNITFLSILFFLIGGFNLNAQDWVSMMRNPRVNVHEVQKAFYQWYNKKHKEDKDKQKSGELNESEEDECYELFKRWEWYNIPRADTNGNRPNLYKIGLSYANYLQNSSSPTQHRFRHSAYTASWTYAGNTTVPTNSSTGYGGNGRVNRVRVFPGNNNIMYACSASGGLWKTTNGGTTWSTNTDQLGDLTTSDIAINPEKTNIMYLAMGDADGAQSIYPDPATIGVLKSYDGGVTWNATGLAYSLYTAGANYYDVAELLIDPDDTSVILAATTFGIWRSANSGATWTQTSAATWFHSMEFHPENPAIVYAASSNVISGVGANFYRSLDTGKTWTNLTSGLPSNANAEGFEIAVTAADTALVYVLATRSNEYDYQGLYVSTNDGGTFTKQSGNPTVPNILGRASNGNDYGTGQGWYDLAMAVSQTNKDSIWVGGINIWFSSNGGVNWSLNAYWTPPPNQYVHADIHDIQFIPGTNSKGYVVGCDGGVFITSNSGTTWTNISNNLEIGQQYCVGPSQTTAGLWLTGWQDNGTNVSGSPWAQTYGGDGMNCFIDWSNSSQWYAQADNTFIVSSNSGGSWALATGGITDASQWNDVWMQSPVTNTTLYCGINNVWKSTNQGSSWTKISTWGTNYIKALAVDSANPNYIYAAQENQVEVTTNGGTSWTNITSGLAGAEFSGIAVNSKSPSHVWVSLSGYSAGNQVFASTNSGAAWTNISTGLPTLPVNAIVYESGSPNRIFVGTDQGVYYHDTVGNAWEPYNTGLPLVMVANLAIYQAGQELIAATYGRGTWETPLPDNSPLPITLVSFNADYEAPIKSVLINWKVATQLNNKYFIVQKTSDGINYCDIDSLPGAGTTPFTQSYSAVDKNPATGVSYYRLKQIDMDGNSTEFSPVAVFIENNSNDSISLYPNPVTSNVTLVYISPDESPLSLNIMDVSGRTVRSVSMNNIQAGKNALFINTSGLSAGIYFIRVTGSRKVYNLKFIKT